jgi:hypothetical protein
MPRGVFKYDWTLVQRYYDEGHGYLQCRAKFGFAKDTWIKAIDRGSIVVRPRRWAIDRVLEKSRSRYTVKRRLLEAGILKNICDLCGISEWRGEPLAIQLDHRNGIRNDHRLENLRMLCPNCHSQTETYAARNRRRFGGLLKARSTPAGSRRLGGYGSAGVTTDPGPRASHRRRLQRASREPGPWRSCSRDW